MAMSRRDYEAIAAAIRGADTGALMRVYFAHRIADAIEAAGNSNFDRARFIAAATGT